MSAMSAMSLFIGSRFLFFDASEVFFPTVHSTAQDVVGNTGAVTILRSHAAAGAVRVGKLSTFRSVETSPTDGDSFPTLLEVHEEYLK